MSDIEVTCYDTHECNSKDICGNKICRHYKPHSQKFDCWKGPCTILSKDHNRPTEVECIECNNGRYTDIWK